MNRRDNGDLAIVMGRNSWEDREAALKRLLVASWMDGWDAAVESLLDDRADRYTPDELLTIYNQTGGDIA